MASLTFFFVDVKDNRQNKAKITRMGWTLNERFKAKKSSLQTQSWVLNNISSFYSIPKIRMWEPSGCVENKFL